MNVLIYGATGMIGQSVLRECLRDEGVASVTTIVRRPTGVRDMKLREVVQDDVTDLAAGGVDPAKIDACFWCLGVSSAGMAEDRYTAITHDLTMQVAGPLAAANPAMTFIFVSGVGADPTGKGRVMWARVKGRTENDVRRLGFRQAYVFRPAFVMPGPGIRSATGWYNTAYAVVRPLMPVIRRIVPRGVASSEEVGRAMLSAVRHGHGAPIIEGADIHRLAAMS